MNGPKTVGHTTRKVLHFISGENCSFIPFTSEGIWLSPKPDAAPILTLFGSTNLNSRSSHLDTELSFVMITSSNALRQRLQEEVQALRQWTGPWKGNERHVPWTTRGIVAIVGGML